MSAELVMATSDGASVVNPVPPVKGADGPELGPEGNGAPGKQSLGKCVKPAEAGHPGNDGQAPDPVANGGNGSSVLGLKLSCGEFVGSAITLVNIGGNGGNGGDGGPGGDGSAGGDAGAQPKPCGGVIDGGRGGAGGKGGQAGGGGDGGAAGDVTVLLGQGLPSSPVTVNSAGGRPGRQGTPGPAGTPGAGGLNSDGTQAPSGGSNGSGGQGSPGIAGYAGSLAVRTDETAPPRSLVISVLPRAHE